MLKSTYLFADQVFHDGQSKQEGCARTATSNDILIHNDAVFRVLVNLKDSWCEIVSNNDQNL